MNNRNLNALTVLASAAALAVAVRGTFAAQSVSYTGGSYTQDFNSLYTLDNTPPQTFDSLTVNPIVIGPAVVGSAPIDLTGSSADGSSIPQISTMDGWWATSFGGNSSPLAYNVDDGNSNNVALMAYFDPANQPGNGTNNMALGALTSSTTGNVVFGVKLVNTTGATLNAISLSYTGQIFHQDTGTKTLTFGYLVDPTGNATVPISGTTGVGSLNVGGFATGTAGALSTSANSTQSLSVLNLPLATAWGANQTLWLTWQMNTAGGGQGLAIDNLSFSASNITVFPSLTWSHTGDGNWNTSDVNWKNGSNTPASFANNNNVIFGDSASNATITVDAGGVTVQQNANITNSQATTYTFAGGSIGGASASLNINGNGTVKLTSANSFGLATNINAGTLIIDNNNELGASTAALNLNGGTLKLAAPFVAGSRVFTVGANGGTINLNGSNATFSSTSITIHGALEVSGGANLDLGPQPTFGSQAAPGGSLVIDAGASVTIDGNGRSSPSDQYSGGIINGNLVLKSTGLGARYNFDSVGNATLGVDHNGDSKFTGTGAIQVPAGSGWIDVGTGGKHNWQLDTNGIVISNTSATYAAEIDVPLELNSTNLPFTPLNVSTANFIGAANPNGSGSFVTVIGGTKVNTQGHGPGFSNLIFRGVISGNSDINVGNDYKNGGSGDMTLYAHNTYAGATIISGGGGLYTAVDDALPPTTNIVFGAIPGTVGGLVDLDGHSQHVQSIEIAIATNAPQANIIQNSGTSNATLYITGNNTPFYPYNAQLNDGGTGTDGVTRSNTLALVKSGSSTLVLGQYLYTNHSTTSTYSGGTTVNGGTLQIGFDGAMGSANGTLTLDGGTLSIQNPQFIGSPDGTENTVSFSSSRSITVTSNGGTITNPVFQATLQPSNSTVTLVEPVTLTGDGGYNWGGNLQYSGAANSSLTINGGAGAVSLSGIPAVQSNANSTIFVGGSTDPFTDSANAAKHVAIVSNGLVDFTAGAKAVAGISGTGAIQVDAGATLTSDGAKVSSLVVNGTHVIRANASSAGTSLVGSLTIAGSTGNWTGHLDLSGNKLVVEAALSKPSVISTLQNQVAYGASHSAGITSSGLPVSFGIAVMDNAVLGKISFGGVAVDSSSVLVSQELVGDSNADGRVDLTDLSAVLNNFGSATSAWTSGNFDGAPTIDLTDLSDVLNNFGASNPNASSVLAFGGASAAIGTPEPTSLALFGIGAVALLRRRKQN